MNSVWTIRHSKRSIKALKKLDKSDARKLLEYLDELAALEDPRARGKALTGPLRKLWRWRVGDWRVIADIQDSEMTIITVDIGHRSSIYD